VGVGDRLEGKADVFQDFHGPPLSAAG